jgi:hypothetical protein
LLSAASSATEALKENGVSGVVAHLESQINGA